jgi:hypothetical protein
MWIKRRKLMLGINLIKDNHMDISSVDFKEKIVDVVKDYVINNWDDVASFENGDNEILVKIDL